MFHPPSIQSTLKGGPDRLKLKNKQMNYFSSNIKFLRKKKKRTQEDVAVSLGLKRTTINALENQISQPSVSHLQAFSKYFKIAIDTLVNVDLPSLSGSQLADLENGFDVFVKGTKLRVIAITVDNNNENNIECVSQKVKAGYTAGYSDPEYISKLPAFQLPFLSNDKKLRAFQVDGDSMLPIPENAWVVCEYLEDFDRAKNGELYVIVTREEGIVFKKVENHITEKGTLKLSSLNPAYNPYELPVMEIMEMWRFVSFISNEVNTDFTTEESLFKMMKELQLQISDLKRKHHHS